MLFKEAKIVKNEFEKLNILYLYCDNWYFNKLDDKEFKYSYEKPGFSGLCVNENDFIDYILSYGESENANLFNNNKGLIFETENKVDEIVYPIIITGIHVFTLPFEDEENKVYSWAYISNEKERESYLEKNHLENIMYFSIKDDKYNKFKNLLKEVNDSFAAEWERIVMRTIHLKGDILITDPCYWVKNKDWGCMEWDNNFKEYGITESICRDTLYGDWFCTTFDSDTKETIGTFSADSGMVCVCLLDEVRAYSGNKIDEYINNGCATVIRDFDGDVKFVIEDDSLIIVGNGNKNFVTSQTGF